MQTDKETISQILGEISDDLRAAAIAQFEEGDWVVELDGPEPRFVTLAADEAASKLFVSTDVGAIKDDAMEQSLLRLMDFNAAWTETGGAWTALDPGEGRVVLFYDIPLDQVTAETLRVVILNHAATAASLGVMLAAEQGESGSEQDHAPKFSQMRV